MVFKSDKSSMGNFGNQSPDKLNRIVEGTNVEEGKRILKESGLNLITADDMEDGARKVVAAAGS